MDIRIEVEDITTVKKRLRVEVPAEVAAQEQAEVAERFRRQVRLPGFRPGKAPLEVVKRRFQKDIRDELVQSLLPKTYQRAIRERDIHPLGEPRLGEVHYEEGQPLVYVAEFETVPPVRAPRCRGLEVADEPVSVSEADVDRELEAHRGRLARLVSVSDRAVEKGDYVVVDLIGEHLDHEAPAHRDEPVRQENVTIQVGDPETLEAFNLALPGMNLGEVRSVDAEYPADYPEQKLAGHKVRFQATVTDIKRRELPDLNDDLAKDLGYDDLAQLREKVRLDLGDSRQRSRKVALRRRVIDKLLADADFEVPDALVEDRIDERIHDLAYNLAAQGVDPAKAKVDWMKVRADLAVEARKDVRARLVLGEIAAQEGIGVSSEEVEAEVQHLVETSNQPPEKVRQQLEKEGRLEKLREDLLRRKALDFVLDNAVIK
jgi:trigger factor